MKRFISIILCTLMLFSAVPFAVNAEAQESEYCEFEYIKRDASSGDGYVIVEFAGEKITLSGDRDTIMIPKGSTVKITMKALLGSAITAVAYDGAPKDFGDPAQELNMTIENFKSDHSLKLTYETPTYNCSVVSSGNGKVTIIDPVTDRTSVALPVGENFSFYSEAENGHHIVSISVNGEEVDLSKYGQTDVIKITRFQMDLPQITEDTQVLVTFSGSKTEYVTLTFEWNQGGICNNGNRTAKVVKGDMYEVAINAEEGYRVAKITDGDKVITNFSGNVYYATNVDNDRKIKVEFEKIPEGFIFGDVNSDGKVNVVDATFIQKSVAGLVTFDAEQNYYGDVDGDSRVTVKDATAVQKHTAGIITEFPVELI